MNLRDFYELVTHAVKNSRPAYLIYFYIPVYNDIVNSRHHLCKILSLNYRFITIYKITIKSDRAGYMANIVIVVIKKKINWEMAE
jgi:hypothetical protein